MTSKLRSAPPKVGTPNGVSALIGLAIGLVIFLLLPVAQWLDAMTTRHNSGVDVVDNAPPPPPQIIDEHVEDKTEQDKIEDLKEAPPPPSLDMLELSLNASLSGVGIGDVEMPQLDVGGDLNDMIFDIKDLDERPQAISQTAPQTPLDLRQAGVSGEVMVEFLVDPRGNTRNIKIIKTSNAGFNENTIRAIRTWKFKPGKKDGKAVTTRVRIPIKFNTNK